jgi:steroid delta-isomerase-like uncharacterized protein
MSDPVQVARALYSAYNERSASGAVELYDVDAVHSEVARGTRAEGQEAIRRGLEGFFTLFPDARWVPLDTIADRGSIAVPYRLTGTLQAPMGPVPARGQRLHLRGIHVLRTRGSLITASEDYWDATTFQAQMNTNPEGAV